MASYHLPCAWACLGDDWQREKGGNETAGISKKLCCECPESQNRVAEMLCCPDKPVTKGNLILCSGCGRKCVTDCCRWTSSKKASVEEGLSFCSWFLRTGEGWWCLFPGRDLGVVTGVS